MNILVGYTGFVGSNLAMRGDFDEYYNSKNIREAFGKNPDLLVYAGVPAQKFIANKFPEEDMRVIKDAINNIKNINPKKIVLISTIDVYNNPKLVNEETQINDEENQPYGKNRHILEEWVKNNVADHLIVRLPGLYGRNIKKNFIYDFIHIIPSMLKEEKFKELIQEDDFLLNYYTKQDNGFYALKNIDKDEENKLKSYFKKIGYSALKFTDSRGVFQFYNLDFLWNHIEIAIKNNIKVLNVATEPVKISEIYEFITDNEFENEINSNIPEYNFKTLNYKIFNGKDGYIFDKEFILEDIKKFVCNELGFKLSASNIGWSEENDEEIYDFLKNNNYRGIEIAPTRLIKENPYDHIEDMKKNAERIRIKYGLEISSMQSIWYGKTQNIFGSKEERIELIKYTEKAIDFASSINCKNLVFGCPKNRNIPQNLKREEAYEIIEDMLKRIGEYANEKNIIFAIEANPIIYNTNFINTTKEAFDLVKKINMDSIKVNVDVGTIIENEEDINELVNNIKYINHIHISEPYLAKIEKRDLYKKIKNILKNENYSKYISIEMKNTNNLEDIKDVIKYIGGEFRC